MLFHVGVQRGQFQRRAIVQPQGGHAGPPPRSLPAEWQGGYADARAHEWIETRDAEGTMLLIIELATKNAVGPMILHESDGENNTGTVGVRLGSVLSETAWDKDFPLSWSEDLLTGFEGSVPFPR